MSSLSNSDLRHLRAACLRGDLRAVEQALGASRFLGCWSSSAVQEDAAAPTGLLTALKEDGGNTLLHYLCSGESLGLLGGLVFSLARARTRWGGGSGGSLWPTRHQHGRAQVLAALLTRQPRLALLAGCRNAAGDTPLHCAVRSQSWQLLALLLAALQQLLLMPFKEQQEAAGATGAAPWAALLQLLLSVPDSSGMAPLELAVRERQWIAVRLLAAAAHGAPPLSQAQLEACSLVQRCLERGGGSWGDRTSSGGSSIGGVRGGSGSGAAGAAASSSIHVSASGSTVTEALGGLLSKLWDAFGSAPAGPAAARDSWDASQLGVQQGAATAGGRADAQQQQQQRMDCVPLHLQLRALGQADVLALVKDEEQQQPVAGAKEAAEVTAAAAGGGPQGCGDSSSMVEPTGANTEGASSSSSHQNHGIVCYEDLLPGQASVQLQCCHSTCDACWRGILLACIDEGNPRRAVCPQPGCGLRLPSSAVARLLPLVQLQRFQQLLAQSYLATHPSTMRSCPSPACGAMLCVPEAAGGTQTASEAAAGGAAAAAAPPAEAAAAATGTGQTAAGQEAAAHAAATAIVASAAAGAGVDAECGACGHSFCWRCGEEAHEPASCDQMRRWGDELAALRRAAPDADRQWLSSNTKRCPQCRAHIQKQGGCNHIACRSCGHHFCWVCGGDWQMHGAATGGFYYCSVSSQRSDLPEYSAGGQGGEAGASLGGPWAWATGVWSSIKAAAQQHHLQRHLRQFLRLSGGRGALQAAAGHMQLLLGAAGMAPSVGQSSEVATAGSSSSSSGSGSSSTSAAQPVMPAAGAELLGISQEEAGRMGRQEWGDLVAASAASAADAAALPVRLAMPAVLAAAEATLAAAVGNSSISSCSGSNSGIEQPAAYLAQLAAAVTAARGLLQHSAVAQYLSPSGPGRRHLQQLTSSIQARLEQLEPLLLALPEREALPQPQSRPQRFDRQRQAPGNGTSKGSSCGSGSGSSGFAAWLLERWYGVELLPGASFAGSCGEAAGGGTCSSAATGAFLFGDGSHAALAALDANILLQQLQFAAAVHQQGKAVLAVVAALQRSMREMHAAARAGLYA